MMKKSISNKILDSQIYYKLFKKNDDIILYTQYQVIHELQLEKLREKIRRGKRIKVIFLVMQASKFGYASIIKEMQKNELFEPIILVASHNDALFQKDSVYYEMAKKDYDIIMRKGYKTFFAYDENEKPIPMWEFSPDIVIYNELTNLGYYKNYIINREYLTCYVGYGMITSNRDKNIYQTYQRNVCWKIFLENRFVYDEYARKSCIRGMNAVLTGYPKLDEYATVDLDKINEKLKNGNKTVIYAPHWSINDCNGYGLNYATFPLYYKDMLCLVKKNPDVNFVFKPHPRLGIRIHELENEKNAFMTYKEYEQYMKEWQNQKNGLVVLDGEYIDLFKYSSCMIMDSGSFISEYLPSENPCIYLLNPKKKEPYGDYNEFSKNILQTYYCCDNWNEVVKIFNNVIREGIDIKKEERNKMQSQFINIGCAGEKIVKYICKQIEEE